MSLKENACRKFQANIFNKSKCQNCFKPRESHLLNDEDLNQAKPIYGGWLLLAPEGTNFDNPLHRSRKWQRRFFILYEHGLLRYALDEMPSTLPQGTINMNQCLDVLDGEARTGQKSSLCILTPDKEHFIRAECREIINGWQDALTVYPRTNKQNQKKKRKVDPPTHQSICDLSSCFALSPLCPRPPPRPAPQEPGPAKVTVTSGSIPCLPGSMADAEQVPTSRATLWQEQSRWGRAAIPCSRSASCLSQLGQSQPDAAVATRDDGGAVGSGRKVRVESGYFSLEKTKSEPNPAPPQHLPLSSSASSSSIGASRRSQIIGRFEENQSVERMDTSSSGGHDTSANTTAIQRQSRSERRCLDGKHEMSLDTGKDRLAPDVSSSNFLNLRRAKSLDRRASESSMTPDLLNFKKGWMTKLYEDGVWKKHWFVLTDQNLRFYKDSIAEEASELDGEIDLSTCYDVKEFPVQRNYGFQILCKDGACTLSAMTSGIRRNWIQAIMKNVRPTVAPDVTRKNISLKLSVLKPRSIPDENIKSHVMLEPSQVTSDPKLDDSKQSPGSNATTPPSEPRRKGVRERRREGRSKTFDWTEFKVERKEKPAKERADTVDLSSAFSTTSSCSPSSSASSLASSPASSSSLQTSSVSAPPAADAKDEPSPEEPGKMDVDHRAVRPRGADATDGVAPDVRQEIEQRWHQVETTPLREEKQVPISTTAGTAERLPANELAALLDKELGQKQQELDRLQQQNSLLKEQLEDALGREQSAREGYVLQSATPPSSSPRKVPWQQLHKLNQDLQGELESQKRKQDLAQQQIRTLRRSYTEAQDAVDRHENDIQALQTKLASAMAEIIASEQAVARMRNELKLEQERSKEQEEEYGRNEATLRAQLKDSEDRLREVEASLLERNQALRHLERQQALQRDHVKEIQRLQERLQEVAARLAATEEGQALKEERLRNEQQIMQEKHERERQNLCRRLAEAESAQKEVEDRLLEAEQQVEALLRGRRASGGKEHKEEMLKLQEQLVLKTDRMETLRESVRRLEEEKGQLTCRCQELLNQITEADREVNKLRSRLETEEADYYTLEHSYERATQEFQKMSQFLREKEEEIKQTKEMYERLMERKEADLKEALVKMTALGSSLEETEQKLQAKEVLLCQMSQSLISKTEPCDAEEDLQAKLVVAEDRIAELEQHLTALQLGYADLCLERKQCSDQDKTGAVKTSSTDLSIGDSSEKEPSSDDKESEAKRPRIRFSSIQCQKYVDPEVVETGQRSSADENISDIALSHTSDPEKFIAIIHALETKLLTTEDKLRNLTQNLDVQRAAEPGNVSNTDPKVSESVPCSPEEIRSVESETRSSSALEHYCNALMYVENGREKVRAMLSGCHGTTDLQLQSLSEVESDLFSASLHIRQGQKTLDEQSPVAQTPEAVDKESLLLFAKTLSFEAAVLNKMALLIQTSKSDLLQALVEIWQDLEHVKTSEQDCLAIVYADVLTRKLMLESTFWKNLEKSEAAGIEEIEAETVTVNTFLKAEITYSMENLKLCYEEKFKLLKRELADAHFRLNQRETALKAIIDASKTPDLKSVIKDVKKDLGISKQKLADIRPPELAPYMEQIEVEEARGLAEEVVDRHLASVLPYGGQAIESFQNTHEYLANELQRQAGILQRYAEEIESSGSHPALSKMIQAVLGHQTSHNVTSASLCMREALIQAQVAYVACRLRATHEQELDMCRQTSQDMEALVQQHSFKVVEIQEKYEASLRQEQENFSQTMIALQRENEALKSELSERVNQLTLQQERVSLLEDRFRKETEELKEKCQSELSQAEHCRASTELVLIETAADSQRKLEVLLADIDSMEERHNRHVRKLEEQFRDRIIELQHLHREELDKLHSQYVEGFQSADKRPEVLNSPPCEEVESRMEEEDEGKRADVLNVSELDSMMVLKDRIQELETQMNSMKDELENKHLEGDVASLREKYQRDFESLKATCERGFAAMEETHQKVVEDLQRQHQREISKLMEERERLLAEETAATIAAIEAMKNAHKEELEKNQRSQLSGLNSDIDELRLQYEEELQSIQRELEVLSEQYSQKCLENAHLAQALEAERQALRQCQRENQELNAHNQELNNRLTAEITRMRSCFSGESALSPLTHGKDVYELEVLLRIKESEIQYLKQEIHSLKDELQSALRDKKYATDKYKDIYTELSIVKAKADCDISKLKEKLLMATEALGERNVDDAVTSGYDIMKSKSNPDFMKKEKSTPPKQLRGLRSKSLKEGLTVQERMKLFEAKNTRKI
ncbi:myosin phosphatase Rho-interacting protein isoform X5 [Poecilia latipinna]|uniref:myosin phosphatase Rho-interacting protein isoform X5 n=1 Tax=Poecilia latipinna TaxID=48699 RepID=UPI00072DAC13|nr:PREDICTED: centrosome-associated protein CEP250-like isoform X5 [Poecilia latipinna]